MRLVEDDADRLLVVLGYPSMAEAADAVPALLARHRRPMIACEGLDARIVDLVRAAGSARAGAAARGGLAVRRGRRRRGRGGAGRDGGRRGAARSGTGWSTDAAEAAALWRIREDGAGLAARSLRPPAYSGWEDAAVPPERLGAWLRDFDELLTRARPRRGALRPLRRRLRARADRLPASTTAGRGRFRDFLDRRAPTGCATHGGSLSGEHGDGRARSELLPLMYDAESLRAVRRGQGDLRPRRTCSTPASSSTRRRSTPTCARRGRAPPVRTALRLVHDGGSLGDAVHRCTGVGKCVAADDRRA